MKKIILTILIVLGAVSYLSAGGPVTLSDPTKQDLDADLTSLAGGVSGIVKGGGDGVGYNPGVSGTDYLVPWPAPTTRDGDTTPLVVHGGFYMLTGSITVTDFHDAANGHAAFDALVTGGVTPQILIGIADSNVTIDFSANANIEGNSGQDFTGDASQVVYLEFKYHDSRWNQVGIQVPMKTPTTLAIKAIEVGTLKASELNDTSDPHLLTVDEIKGSIITNSESVGADEWDFPARTEGWNFIYVIEAAQNVTLDPNGTEQWYLNGTQLAAGEAIVNAAPAVGASLTCFSTETAVYCESKYAAFAEETP